MRRAGDEIAVLIASSSSTEEANMRLEYWKTASTIFDPVGDLIFVTTVMADMAGQLMVAGREAEIVQLAKGEAKPPVPKSFLNLQWQDAINAFRKRGLVRDSDFQTLLRGYAQRSAVARKLMLDQIQSEVMRHLDSAITNGETFPEFAGNVNKLTESLGLAPGKPSYLQMVFRTNVQSAYGAGRYKAIRNPIVQRTRPYVQYRTVGDARVRDEHKALDGKVFRSDSDTWHRVAPPNGFNCFPGSALVQGTFTTAIRARYTGQLVKLTTQSGRTLSVTPNHPLLTPSGFVAAGSLAQGSHVICYHARDEVAAIGDVDPENVPAKIEDVFDAIEVRNSSTVRLRPAPDDLDGDAQLFEGDVDVVSTDRKLLRHIEAVATQRACDSIFSATTASASREVRGGGAADLGVAAFSPASAPPRSSAPALDSSAIETRPLQSFSVGAASYLNTSRYQPSTDGAPAGVEFVCQLLHRHAGRVLVDEVVRVEVEWFHGFVYDVESPYGWLVADGIFASNCRCSMVTLSAEQAKGLEVSDEIPEDYVATPGFDQAPMPEIDLNTEADTEVDTEVETPKTG